MPADPASKPWTVCIGNIECLLFTQRAPPREHGVHKIIFFGIFAMIKGESESKHQTCFSRIKSPKKTQL
jgi:hypothetical protein